MYVYICVYIYAYKIFKPLFFHLQRQHLIGKVKARYKIASSLKTDNESL